MVKYFKSIWNKVNRKKQKKNKFKRQYLSEKSKNWKYLLNSQYNFAGVFQ